MCASTLKIVTIDPNSYTPVYVQLADIVRDRIDRGVYIPGQVLPSEQQLMQEFGLARITVRQAIKELRGEGIVVTEPRRGTYVRETVDRQAVVVDGPAEVSARMPTPEERRDLELPPGVPVLVVEREGGELEVLAADQKIVKVVFDR